jgi:hypothetical protein
VPISLGDAFRVEGDLRPRDVEARVAIEKLLGLDQTAAPPVTSPIGPWKPNEPRLLRDRDVELPYVAQTSPVAAAEREPPRFRGLPATWDRAGRTTFSAPSWVAGVTERFEPAAGDDSSLPPPSIFAPTQKRALLSAATATFRDGPEVDVEQVTSLLAQGVRPRSIPYRKLSTLSRGAQVLVDTAETMDPLRADIGRLIADLEPIFGRGRFDVLHFAYCPSARDRSRRGVWTAGQRGRRPWRAAGPGVPVLVVSDFTIAPAVDDADYASTLEWIEFAGDVLAAGCLPVGLVPYAPDRWPPALARKITFLHWSERTTAGQVKKAVWEAGAGRRARP